MRRAGRKLFRRDEFLARPDTAQRIQAIRQRFAEDDDVRLDVEVFNAPELSGAIEAHLNLVVNKQDIALVQDFFECRKIFGRRDDVTARALNRLDVKCGELALACLRIPELVVLSIKILLELLDAVE